MQQHEILLERKLGYVKCHVFIRYGSVAGWSSVSNLLAHVGNEEIKNSRTALSIAYNETSPWTVNCAVFNQNKNQYRFTLVACVFEKYYPND